jgi:hypothetical protein
MSCTYTIKATGQTLTLWEMDDYLKSLEPEVASQWMKGINAIAKPEAARFSLKSDIQDALSESDFARNTQNFTDKMIDSVNSNVYALATQRHLADMAKGLTAMPKYIKERTMMDKTVEKVMQVSDKIAKKWEHLVEHSEIPFKDSTRKAQNKAEQKKLANVMHFATVYGQDPRADYVGKANDLDARSNYNYVKTLYGRLNPTAQEVFSEVADDHKAHLGQIIAAEKANVEATTATREAKDKMLEELARIMNETKIYFPLSRFGKYSIYFNQEGTKYFKQVESKGEMERFIKANPDIEVLSKGLELSDMKAVNGVSGEFMGSVDKLANDIESEADRNKFKDGMYQLYLKSLPDMSARKHFMHRNKTPGFHEDALRGYASKSFHDARLIGRLEHSGKLEKLLKDMRDALKAAKGPSEMAKLTDKIDKMKALTDPAVINHAAGMDAELNKLYEDYKAREPDSEKRAEMISKDLADAKAIQQMAEKTSEDHDKYAHIVNELQLSHEAMMNPQTASWASFFNTIGFGYYIGLSLSTAAVNGLQTPTVALPYMASKHGFTKASAVLLREYKEFYKGQNEDGHYSIGATLTGVRKDAFNELLDRGIITRTLAMDLIGLSDEGVNAGSARRKMAYGMAYAFNRVEVQNREVTGMAAFDLEYAANGGDFEKAMAYTDEIVNTTHGDYNPNNRARIMRGNVARVLTQFKQYSQFQTYNWAKAVLEASGVLAKKAKGIPLTTEDKQAVKLLVGLVGMQGAMAGVMGLPIGGALVIMQAIASMAGDDDDPIDVGDEIKAMIYNYVPGIWGDAVARGPLTAFSGIDFFGRLKMDSMFFRDPQKDLEGKYGTQWLAETLAGPMGGMVQNLFDFVEMWGDDYKGKAVEKLLPKAFRDPLAALRILSEVNAFDVFMKTIGFSDADTSLKYDVNFTKSRVKAAFTERRTHLMDVAARARLESPEAFNKVWNEEIVHWNEVNPEPALRITKPQVMKSVLARRRTSSKMENGFIVNKKLAFLTDKYNYNTED